MPSTPRCIAVHTAAENYDIHIGAGASAQLGQQARAWNKGRKAFVLTNPGLHELYGERIGDSLRAADYEVETCLVPDGERSKTLRHASRLFTKLARMGADRQSIVFALGGGVIGDLSGFVAASYMRGIPLVHVPTSLLAMVDSSIGGKTGVNHPLGKNLIGAFYPPRMVVTDTSLLASLPEREYLCGLSEIVKAGAIGDPELFAFMEDRVQAIRDRDEGTLTTLIERAIAVKVRVVQEDPTEKGVRAILNFGHTIGHALEAATAYANYTHGEAVAIGMALVARLSEQLDYCTAEVRERLCRLLETLRLPTAYSGIMPERLLDIMAHDKKSVNGVVRFVMLEDIGAVAFQQSVPLDVLQGLLEEYAEAPAGAR